MKQQPDKRETERINNYFPVYCVVSGYGGGQEEVICAISENISAKGMKMFCDKRLDRAGIMHLKINFAGSLIEKDAQIVWMSAESKFNDSFCIGVEFETLLPKCLYPNLASSASGTGIELPLNVSRAKRVMDVTLSFLFLFLLLPLMLLTSILIWIDSPGPVFFKQWRAGKNGKRFLFLKFRSMYYNASQIVHKEYAKKFIMDSHLFGWISNKAVYKLVSDSRITRLGHMIRKLSIDEAPQFFNVLKGEMSIVGPRPPIFYELEFYDKNQRRRLLVKPGITGLWQVSGRSTTSFAKMIEFDISYIENWSLWLDLKIMLKTMCAVFRLYEAY